MPPEPLSAAFFFKRGAVIENEKEENQISSGRAVDDAERHPPAVSDDPAAFDAARVQLYEPQHLCRTALAGLDAAQHHPYVQLRDVLAAYPSLRLRLVAGTDMRGPRADTVASRLARMGAGPPRVEIVAEA